MSALVVWMDSHEAKILHLTPQGTEDIHFKSHGHQHSQEVHGKNHLQKQTDEGRFYHELATQLGQIDAQEWLVTGPGLAQEHFQAHLAEHHPQLAQRIVGVTKSDHPTRGQLLQEARKFFKHLDLFGPEQG